ncbi:MAG TPA: PKD domain-containing protein, partial [bacterium]|nr:PKD domain-containing protein [bacterium]
MPTVAAGVGDLLAGRYALDLDLTSLQATVAPSRGAAAQPPQNLQYDLDLAKFLTPGVLSVTGVGFDGDGDVVVSLRHRHPFPAPDLALPPSALNRADLGYTGRLLVKTTGTPHPFFGGEVTVDPSLVKNPDGYIAPEDLLLEPAAGTATAHPYLLLVDEAEDNRVGRTNGGVMTGNYIAAFGWQASTLPMGWYGYDYLHAGQAANIDLTLKRPALGGGRISLDLALLIKYTDPKGTNGKADRFPAQPADLTRFAYRLPYAALDVSAIQSRAPLGIDNGGGTAPIEVAVRDWDARALEASDGDLSDEPDPRKVPPEASGAPAVEFDAPAIADLIMLTEVSGSGVPGDEVRYGGVLQNTRGAGPGHYVGLVRATDPEDGDPAAGQRRFGLDPVTLAPDANRALAVRTYQAVPIAVVSVAPQVVSVSPTGSIGVVTETVQFAAVTTNNPTAWAWDFGGGTIPNTSTDPSPVVNLLTAGTYTGSLTLSNAAGAGDPFAFTYTVMATNSSGWALTWGGGFNDSGNDVAVGPTGEIFMAGAITWNGLPDTNVDYDPTAGVDNRIPNGWGDAYIVRVGPTGSYRWSIGVGGEDEAEFGWVYRDSVYGLALDWARNCFYVVGTYSGQTVDFDPGPGQAGDVTPVHTIWSFLAKYDLDGQFQWVRSWGNPATYHTEDSAVRVELDANGNPVVVGFTYGGSDLMPGAGQLVPPTTAFSYTYLSHFDFNGNHVDSQLWGNTGGGVGFVMDPSGIHIAGT